MKTVILGGTGLLGSSIYHNLISNKYNCLTTSKNKKSNLKTNHLSKNIILKFLKKNQPKLVINCVAETNVDLCNKEGDLIITLKPQDYDDLINQLTYS